MIRARDLPMGFGDMDASLYLLFRAIREHSTVALSGESADEVFGGYLQFFDERARSADTFPWLVRMAEHFGEDSDVLRRTSAGPSTWRATSAGVTRPPSPASNGSPVRATSSTGCAGSATST